MTKPAATPLSSDDRCHWCFRPIERGARTGRPRLYCCRSHRQRAYEARRRAVALDLGPGQVVVAEADLRRLGDLLYQLEAAIDDVSADLGEGRPSPDVYRRALEHLLVPARELAGTVIEPAAG